MMHEYRLSIWVNHTEIVKRVSDIVPMLRKLHKCFSHYLPARFSWTTALVELRLLSLFLTFLCPTPPWWVAMVPAFSLLGLNIQLTGYATHQKRDKFLILLVVANWENDIQWIGFFLYFQYGRKLWCMNREHRTYMFFIPFKTAISVGLIIQSF